jgi:GTP pyrophosphokinase
MIVSDRFEKALIYATRLHTNLNGSAMSYIAHLLSVCGIALEHGADEDEAIAALLHGSIKDAGEKGIDRIREEIREAFGDKILEIVNGFTDMDVYPIPPLAEQREAYLARLRDSSSSVRFILAADKLQNAKCILHDYRELGEELWKNFKGGREGTLWYYSLLIAELRKGTYSPIVEELDRVVMEIGKLVDARKSGARLAAMDKPLIFQ